MPPFTNTSIWIFNSDPALRYQVLRDLLHAPAADIAAERARIATLGLGAQLLSLQGPDGQWGNQTWSYPDRTSTFDALHLLTQLGIDPASPQVRAAIHRILQHNVNWGPEWNHSPFFEGEVEPCINGRTLAIGSYFGHPSENLANRLLSEQLDDGGWNCQAPPSKRSSFHSTLCVLDGLLAYEKATSPTPQLTAARQRGQEYLLHRHLLRTASTGTIINLQWTLLAFPSYWHYDILKALDYFRRAGAAPAPRMSEAITLLKSKRDKRGRWHLQHTHPGTPPIDLKESPGKPSRWLTLHALRVLHWYNTA
jgi:hypothetical protein